MSNALSSFASGLFLSAALIMAIGSQNLFVFRQGLRGEHVAPIVLFCGAADTLLIAAGVSGMGSFLAAIPQLTTVLAAGGAAFLGWYGIKAFRRMLVPDAMVIGDTQGVALGRALATTAAFTFLNPHVYLDTVLLMGTAGATQPDHLRPIFVAGAGMASFMWFAALGFGARLLKPSFCRPAAWRILDALVGTVMVILATSLIASVLPAFG
jgi:L-lysine exporter family protein LysE/ArgO